ncbi:uncharacterized protein [Atheta coriaria]|uniref:uncharacterized protein isoform X2 n=2 Tax=Dalotia coriaria TaxID=877792 RepID=UPI0031F3B269
MDENFISLAPNSENTKRKFWSLRLRKTVIDDKDEETKFIEENNTSKWKNRMRVGKTTMKNRKQSRLSIWKSWFLALLKSKSNIKRNSFEELKASELVDLNCIPSYTKFCESFDLDTDSILKSFQNASPVSNKEESSNDLGMAITLPGGVKGKDIKVDVELKVSPKDHNTNQSENNFTKGLHLIQSDQKETIYSGTVKVPSGTNILQVSQMPLYLLNGDATRSEQRVETIIKPVNNVLPEDYDNALLIDEINLRLCIESNIIFDQTELSHEFVTNVIPMVERDDEDKASIVATSEISFDFDNNSRISLDTKDMIEQITGEMDPSYDETSKTLVKEILNQVVSRISFKSSTDLIEDFHKELEVQKIILLETASSILPKTDSLLSKISETEQEDASCSSTSSKNIAPDIAQSSDLSLSNYTSRSELKLHMKVPSNTPDAFKASLKYAEEEQLKLTQKMLKEDVKADIDKTLQLLETAKNKLLTYLNQGQTPIDNAAKINNDKITIDPFKSLENKELFPVPPKLPETPKKEVDFKYEDVFAYNKKKTKDFSDNKKPKPEETAIVEIGPRNNPIHELKHMFLDEFKKQVDFVPTVTDDEVFDLENLAHANVFVDNKKIKTMIDRYLTPEQIKDLKEDEMISHNTDIFEKRYSSSSESAKPSKITQERLRDDIDIIVRELLEHSAAFQDYVKANEQGDSTNDTIEDVKFVLEKLLQHVVDEVSTSENDAPKTPLDYQSDAPATAGPSHG